MNEHGTAEHLVVIAFERFNLAHRQFELARHITDAQTLTVTLGMQGRACRLYRVTVRFGLVGHQNRP